MPLLELKDLSLYYEIKGDGEPLILISNLANDSQSWQFVAGSLSRHFRLITLDLRSCGQSTLSKSAYTVSHMAMDIIQLLNHLKIEGAHIIGHGIGGYIAQEIAIKYPERIYKLILESTSPVVSERNKRLFQTMLDQFPKQDGLETWLRNLYFWYYSPMSIEKSNLLDALVQYMLDYPYEHIKTGFTQQVAAIKDFDSRDRLKNILHETMILIGEEDILVAPKETEILYQGITHATYPIYIENAAHMIHVENPKAFINAVISFLYKFNR